MRAFCLLGLIGGWICVPSTAGALPVSVHTFEVADSATIRKNVETAVQDFLMEWRRAWKRTNENWYASTKKELATMLRSTYLHCDVLLNNDRNRGLIREREDGYVPAWGTVHALAKCPSWVLGPLINGADAAIDPDGTLDMPLRSPLRDARQRLLSRLAAARSQLPGDPWIIGQQVRFLVEQGQRKEAVEVAASCRIDRWWCSALHGYARARDAQPVIADSLFRIAEAALSDSVRCAWTDVGTLLRPKDHQAYNRGSCAQRDTLSTRYLWLSAPLFIDPINERRVAHFMRRVTVMLHSALPEDAYYHWNTIYGGDAVAEVIMRYGWPSVLAWRKDQDAIHTQYVTVHRAKLADPYSSAEYTVGRVQFSPQWAAVASPFEGEATAWELRPPRGRSEDQTKGNPMYRWWPIEHMPYPARRIAVLPDAQIAVLRRQSEIRVAAAVDAPSASTDTSVWRALDGEQIAVTLVASDAPDRVERIAEKAVDWSGRIVLDGYTQSRPFVAGVESAGNDRIPVVMRTRLGIMPPPNLDALAAGTIAISAPIFYRPLSSSVQPSDADAVIPRMLGTTTVPFGGRVGLFWEAYGVNVGDSVSFTITVAPESGPGLLRRVGAALRLVDTPADGVAVGWTDGRQRQQPGAANPNTVPILPRSLIVDLRHLQPGPYVVEVTLSVSGKPTVRGQRALTIQ